MANETQPGESTALTMDAAVAAIESLGGDDYDEPGEDEGSDPRRGRTEPTGEEEDEPDTEEGDGEGDEEEGDEPELHKVKVAGEEVEVTYDELVRGYQRQGDYMKKTQQLAAERQEVTQAKRSALETADLYAETLEATYNFLGEKLAPEQVQRMLSEHAAVRRAQAEHFAAEMAQTIEAERARLAEALPEWKDEKVATSEKAAIRDYAESYGYTAEDLSHVTDHRLMLIVRKAMLYDKLTTTGAEQIRVKKADAPRVLAPGHRDTSPQTGRKAAAERRALQTRLARSGRASDAAALIAAMEDD